MIDRGERRIRWIVVVTALVVFALAGLFGGPAAALDVSAIKLLATDRATYDGLTRVAIDLTVIGGALGMLSMLALAIGGLWFARGWRAALTLGAIVLSGRAAVELIKIVIRRPRPHFGPYPVKVTSLSFPSAHAADSMMTFLTLALLLAPPHLRGRAVTAAVALSLAIGITRPFLGVHWPSDVIAGWAFGIAWAVGLTGLATAYGYWPASRASLPA